MKAGPLRALLVKTPLGLLLLFIPHKPAGGTFQPVCSRVVWKQRWRPLARSHESGFPSGSPPPSSSSTPPTPVGRCLAPYTGPTCRNGSFYIITLLLAFCQSNSARTKVGNASLMSSFLMLSVSGDCLYFHLLNLMHLIDIRLLSPLTSFCDHPESGPLAPPAKFFPSLTLLTFCTLWYLSITF